LKKVVIAEPAVIIVQGDQKQIGMYEPIKKFFTGRRGYCLNGSQ
jgi:hypothetical protein